MIEWFDLVRRMFRTDNFKLPFVEIIWYVNLYLLCLNLVGATLEVFKGFRIGEFYEFQAFSNVFKVLKYKFYVIKN